MGWLPLNLIWSGRSTIICQIGFHTEEYFQQIFMCHTSPCFLLSLRILVLTNTALGQSICFFGFDTEVNKSLFASLLNTFYTSRQGWYKEKTYQKKPYKFRNET